MHQWALPTIAVMLLAYGAVSGRLRSTPVSHAMVFVALGLLAGNRILDLVEVETANQFVRHLAEATLTLVLFCDAVRVNRGRLRHESALPTRLLVVGLPLTIVAGTLAGLALFPRLDLWTAAALAIMLAPTDAALGLPVVTNPRLPSRIRQSLTKVELPQGGSRRHESVRRARHRVLLRRPDVGTNVRASERLEARVRHQVAFARILREGSGA